MGTHKKTLTANQVSDLRIPKDSLWAKLPIIGLVLGVAGIGASVALHGGDYKQFFHSYLVAYMYFLSLALGGLFFVLIQYAARAGWSVLIRRIAENMMITLPVFALLFLPIVFGGGMDALYHHWTHAHGDPLVAHKAAYLNVGAFKLRALGYFTLWTVMAVYFYANSTGQDRTGDKEITRKLQSRSAPGIALFALSLTFAGIDWVMSMDPHWYSTMWGVYYFAGSTVSTFAFLGLVSLGLRKHLNNAVTVEHLHDIGKLTFAFTVFWTYIAFSQYFLIWYANIPEETVWYSHRLVGSWQTVGTVMAIAHFGIPFFFLLPRTIKRHPKLLGIGVTWMLIVHFVDLHWQIMPVIHHGGFAPHLLDATTFVGIGGIFLAVFGFALNRESIVPFKDPRLSESLSFENF